MKITSIALICAAVTLPAIARVPAPHLASTNSSIGYPRAKDALPGVILALDDDSGRPVGSVVFNAAARESEVPHVSRFWRHGIPPSLSGYPHTILSLQAEGYTLRVVVIRRNEQPRA